MSHLAIDLFCGLGGWTDGLIANGYKVVGFDIEARPYPAQLVLQDVTTIHGRQFKDAKLIVASPPCQEFSYMAMPWSKAKEKQRMIEASPAEQKRLTALFDACFRIQREASEAAGRYIPMVVENVRGAQKWVGRAKWHYGSFYLWGDVPMRELMLPGFTVQAGAMTSGVPSMESTHLNVTAPLSRNGQPTHTHLVERKWKQPGISGQRTNGKGDRWFEAGAAHFGSKSSARKMASAMIAKIPFPLSDYIAKVYAS